MEDLKRLHLQASDFDLIMDALEALPSSGMAGEMMGDLISLVISKDDKEGREMYERKRDQRQQERLAQQKAQKELIVILQGKMLGLKRALAQNDLLEK